MTALPYIFAWCLLAGLTAYAGEMRTWVYKTGTTLQASLVEDKDGWVVLQKEDGSRVQLQRRNFSKEDLDFLDAEAAAAKGATPGATVAAGGKEPPSKLLEGVDGFRKALESQKEIGAPIIVWTTIKASPYFRAVEQTIQQGKARKAVRSFVKVVVDYRGSNEDVALCRTNGFEPGYFYILRTGDKTYSGRVWAFKDQSGGREIRADLGEVLAAQAPSPAAKVGK